MPQKLTMPNSTICFVTSNRGKADTARRLLSRHGIRLRHVSIDMPEPRSFNLREIAHAKARIAYSRLRKPCIVQDSGFYIKAANGFPRTFVNFGLATLGIRGMLKLVEGRDRSCQFKACLTYCESQGKYLDFMTINKGKLSGRPRGVKKEYHWSELFKVFIPEGSRKTLAEMSRDEYENWYDRTNRNSEMMKFARWYAKKGKASR